MLGLMLIYVWKVLSSQFTSYSKAKTQAKFQMEKVHVQKVEFFYWKKSWRSLQWSYSLTSILVVWESHDLLISSFFFTALYRTFCFIPRAEINFFQRDIKLQGSSALWNFFLKLQQLVMYCNLKQNFSKMCHQIFSRKVLY